MRDSKSNVGPSANQPLTPPRGEWAYARFPLCGGTEHARALKLLAWIGVEPNPGFPLLKLVGRRFVAEEGCRNSEDAFSRLSCTPGDRAVPRCDSLTARFRGIGEREPQPSR